MKRLSATKQLGDALRGVARGDMVELPDGTVGQFVGYWPGKSSVWIAWEARDNCGIDEQEFITMCEAFDRLFPGWIPF